MRRQLQLERVGVTEESVTARIAENLRAEPAASSPSASAAAATRVADYLQADTAAPPPPAAAATDDEQQLAAAADAVASAAKSAGAAAGALTVSIELAELELSAPKSGEPPGQPTRAL